MSDPWDDDVEAGNPWDDDVAVPAASRSERTLRDLSVFGGRFDPVGAGEMGLSIGTGFVNEALRGYAGIAGAVAGAVPGGESPSEKANRWLEAIPDITYEPRTQGGETGMAMAGAGAEKLVEGAKYVGSGYAAAAALPGGVDEAALAAEDFRETPDALAEGVFQATGSPTLAAVAKILPEIASMGAAPAKMAPKAARAPVTNIAPDMPPSGFGGVGKIDTDAPEPPRAAVEASANAFERIRDAIRRGDKQAIIDEVNANPAIVAAFDDLGIEFTPAMVSENAALRQIEAGLASKADSGLPAAHELVEFKLNEKAQQLIDDAGGKSGDPAVTAQNIETRYQEIHQKYIKDTEAVWDELERVVPRGADIDVRTAAERILEEARLAGKGDIDAGLRSLSKHERELFRLTHKEVALEDGSSQWVYEDPAYAAIDRYRRKLGLGMDNRGPFNDATAAELDLLYGQMAEAQGRVATGNGYGDLWQRGNQLVQERKALEAAMQRVSGRALNQSVVTRLNAAANALLKGDVKKWDQLFADLPAGTQQAAAAQALESVFFTAGKGTKLSQSFVANFQRIKRSAQVRDRIFDPLPMEARKTFMDIGEAATGFYRAMEKLNRSNTANAMQVVKAIEQPGFMNRVLGGGLEKGTARVPILRDWIQQVTGRTSEAKTGGIAERLKAGADLLADPALHRAIVEYANGNLDKANQILKESQSWLKWAKTQPIPQQERILAAGVVALFEEDTE